ncbi:MAG: hypothetical protein M3063_00900 [Actinomycetota bacterium]|nr:hypothetical protein [Actinomycetota bacterium]
MHLVAVGQRCGPFPPTRRFGDATDRGDAHRAIGFSDVSTSLVVFIGCRVSRRSASTSHPYGYERAEDSGLGVAPVIWASGDRHRRQPGGRPLQGAGRSAHPVGHLGG